MELGGVLWLVSVVMRCCQLLSGNSCGVISVDIFIIFSFLKDPCGCFLWRRWRLDLISGAELAHPVASRLLMMILSFSDFIFLRVAGYCAKPSLLLLSRFGGPGGRLNGF